MPGWRLTEPRNKRGQRNEFSAYRHVLRPYPLPTAYCLLPTAYCLLPTALHLLQGDLQISNNVVPIFEAKGHADALGMHAEGAFLLVGQS